MFSGVWQAAVREIQQQRAREGSTDGVSEDNDAASLGVSLEHNQHRESNYELEWGWVDE